MEANFMCQMQILSKLIFPLWNPSFLVSVFVSLMSTGNALNLCSISKLAKLASLHLQLLLKSPARQLRSEERRVGKECRSRVARCAYKVQSKTKLVRGGLG